MRSGVLLLFSALLLMADAFAPADVAILGDLDYDHTSDPLECTGKQKYCSVLFNGNSGDRVEITVRAEGREKPFVALADGSLTELAHGSGQVTGTLPDVTDKLATYYIVFRDAQNKPGQFTVQLRLLK